MKPGGKAKKPKGKVKKTKTFTGCATCRQRKIKCDLGRPFCKRCEKSGLECAGYQINLCWSKPIQFDKYGYQLPSTREDDEGSNNNGSFQRRNIDFVRYDREYETYDEMDRDLGLLHTPEYSLIEDRRTWLQGPFGVFEGLLDVPSDILKKRRKLNKTKYVRRFGTPTGSSAGSSGAQGGQPGGATGSAGPAADSTLGNEWLSNELRYDALLSATAAIPNDTNNLFDFMAPFTASSAAETPLNANSFSFNTENNLFFNDRQVFDALKTHHYSTTNSINTTSNPSPSTVANTMATAANAASSSPYNHLHLNTLATNALASIDSPDSRATIGLSTKDSKMPDEIIKIIDTPVSDNISSMNIPTKGLYISSLLRFLLNYWSKNVADLMTVIAFPSNPWKKIYFPRALEALGDLTGIGKTSDSRNSLLNALLAVSCFNLQSKFDKGSKEMKFFLNLGIEFRLQASSFLKRLIRNDDVLNQEKYKDVITAILSMNTIDVVWGTMADCQYHLSICEKIISSRMRDRPKLSNKAKLLHRIFSFLKLMQDSTNGENLNKYDEKLNDKLKEIFKNSEAGKNTTQQNTSALNSTGTSSFEERINSNGEIKIEVINNNSPIKPYSPIFIEEILNAKSIKNSNVLFLTDALYGLPYSLILLFNETIMFMRVYCYVKRNNSIVGNNAEKTRQYNEYLNLLDKKLNSWENEWILKNDNGEFPTNLHEGIYNHVMSFYYGLLIYFNTMIKEVQHDQVQNYVENTINHLINLQKLINEEKVKILPLFWQGFIAGCSATKPELQLKFKDWSLQLSKTGMGSYWGARQIMFEVWRRRENGESRDDWLSVHGDWEMNLMLM